MKFGKDLLEILFFVFVYFFTPLFWLWIQMELGLDGEGGRG